MNNLKKILKKASLPLKTAIVPAILFSACDQPEKQEETKKTADEELKRPNIIMFYTDDNAFWYWGFGGGPKLSPNIDKIADEGVECTQFYCSSAVCTPSRYSLHTGKFAGRCQHENFLESYPENEPYCITWNTFLDAEKETTLGDIFQKEGYTTAFVGKWHMSPHGGLDYGFNADDDPADPEVDKKLKKYQQDMVELIKSTGYDYASSITPYNNDWHPVDAVNVHNLEWYAKGAMDFLDMHENNVKPFFLIVNITTHHGPCHIESINSDIRMTQAGLVDGLENVMPPRSTIFDRIEEKSYEVNFKTAGTVWTDDCVAAVLDHAEKTGFDDNTAVIFTTDHNRYDGKATCYQGGVHIPYIMKYDGVIPAGSTCNQRIQIIDMLPTLAEMCDVSLPDNIEIDGISAWKAINGQMCDQKLRDDLYFDFGYTRGILHENWKYIAFRLPDSLLNNMKNGTVEKAYTIHGKIKKEPPVLRYKHYFDPDQLYNIKEDPDEQVNLAYDPQYREKLQQMQKRLKAYLTTFDHPFELDEVDEFYFTDEYKKLCEKARIFDMNTEYWYRKGCY